MGSQVNGKEKEREREREREREEDKFSLQSLLCKTLRSFAS
jgi:hypothetical protein